MPTLWKTRSARAVLRQAGNVHVDLATAITQELRRFVASSGTRRALPTACHVGRPAGAQVSVPDAHDHGLRTDLVVRAIDGLPSTEGACAWVTRGGDLDTTDTDMAWFAAAQAAFTLHGLALPAFVVVTRSAWLDLVSEEHRVWRRVRTRRPAA
jgi:hypothetical protein